jgi:hypothetical protein
MDKILLIHAGAENRSLQKPPCSLVTIPTAFCRLCLCVCWDTARPCAIYFQIRVIYFLHHQLGTNMSRYWTGDKIIRLTGQNIRCPTQMFRVFISRIWP